jgi:hypothetical protein
MTMLGKLAESHGIPPGRMRTLILNGFAEPGCSGVEPARVRTFRLAPDETLKDAVRRLVRDFPVITDREQLRDFRDALIAFDGQDTPLSDARLIEAVNVLGRIPPPVKLRDLIGGTRPHLSAFLTRLKSGQTQADIGDPITFSTETILRHVMEALAADHDRVMLLSDFGLMDLTRTGVGTFADLPRDRIAETLIERFWAMPRKAFDAVRLNQYVRIRRLLGVGTDERHPPGLLEDVIDWLIALRAKPEKTEIRSLIWGCKGQIHDALVERFRRGDPVVLPKRTVKRYPVTLEDLRAVVHPTLKHAFRTALDPERAHPKIMPRDVDMIGVIENSHPILQQIGAIVAVAGQAMPQFSNLRIAASILLRDLAGPMTGADPTNSADVWRVLETQYIIAMASQGTERRRLLSNVACWPWAVAIFEAYRHQEGLPTPIARYLATIAPAVLQGNDSVIKKARRELDAASDARYEKRTGELGDLLDNVSTFYPEIERRRNETKCFRRRVMELHEKSQAWPISIDEWRVEGVHTTIDEHAPLSKQKRNIHFAIHSWQSIKAQIKTGGSQLWRRGPAKTQRHIPEVERALFENNYVVEFLRCTHEDGSAAEPPRWFGLFIKRVFWPTCELQNSEVVEAFAVRDQLGVSTNMLKNLARGLGDFAGRQKTFVRHARRHLGMILLPVDEWDHLEALALYSVSVKLDEPVRTSEHLQFNIGSGLDVHEGADGVNYTVFRSWRKKKPLIHDFMISRESELLTEEFLGTTSRRKYGGGPIPPVAKPRAAGGRAKDFERYNLAYGDITLDASRVDVAVVCMSWGIHSVGVVNFKYFWNKLAEEKGMTLEERRDAQGHVRESTTVVYNPTTPKQREEGRGKRRNAIQERRERLLTPQRATQAVSQNLTALTERAVELRQTLGTTPEGMPRDALLREYAEVQASITAHHMGGRLGAKVSKAMIDG